MMAGVLIWISAEKFTKSISVILNERHIMLLYRDPSNMEPKPRDENMGRTSSPPLVDSIPNSLEEPL